MATLPKKDVVLIGYGAAAGPLSLELAAAGYSVLALERGEYRTTSADFSQSSFDTLRWDTRGEMLPTLQELPLTFRTDLNEPATPRGYIMANTVGGASVHWSGQSWRYYEEDFRVRSTIEERYGKERLQYLREDGANITDWPVTYDEFEPYYEKVEYHIGVGGWPGNINGEIRPVNPDEGNPFEAPRKKDYPFRPLRDNATDLTYREGALSLGLNPFHVPTAITTEPYTSPNGTQRAACTYCTFCTGYGCWNGSKGSSLVSHLPAAEATGNFELRPNSHVLKINRQGNRAISVEYLDLVTGEHHVQPGEIFVLGAYSFQNVRLLLYSGIESDGQVGKYFINRAGPSVSGIFDDRYLNGYNGPAVQRQGLDDFNGENAAEEKLRLADEDFFIRGAFMGSPSQRFPLDHYDSVVPSDVPKWGADYKRYLSENLNRYIGLQLLTEPIPYETSYIDLDPTYTDRWGVPAARVQRQAKENEIRMSRFIYQKGIAILEAAGASKTWGRETPIATPTMTHDCGGLRMGENPSMSVTNRYCQMWEIPNIIVGGGAVLPTMSGHNPTETIWMLSYWTADAIKEGKINLFDAQDFT